MSMRVELSAYKFIVETLCREYGLFLLPGTQQAPRGRYYLKELVEFLLNERDTERFLDAVQLSFQAIDRFTRGWDYLHRQNASEVADAAISELNERFREHGVGYQFENDELMRVDSQFLHADVVKPALALLRESGYRGAEASLWLRMSTIGMVGRRMRSRSA